MGGGRVPSSRLLLSHLPFRNTISRPSTPVTRRFFGVLQGPPTKARLPRSLPTARSAPDAAINSSLLSRYFRCLRFNSSKSSPNQTPNPTPHLGSPEPALSLSQRLRKLTREYGWSALGVYFALTALDLPFCFLGVRMLGVERVGYYEHVVLEAFWNVVQVPFPNLGKDRSVDAGSGGDMVDNASTREGQLGWSGDVEAAEERNQGAEASIWTQLVLAYAIHKSFIFIRVPVTAAITPKVVKTLRGWGWNIGKRTPKAK